MDVLLHDSVLFEAFRTSSQKMLLRRWLLGGILMITAWTTCGQATFCNIWTTPLVCEGKFTDSGGCEWDYVKDECVPSGKALPAGTYGVAIVELDPNSAPPELKPGPSTSFGSTGNPDLMSPDLRPSFVGEDANAVATTAGPDDSEAPSPQSEPENDSVVDQNRFSGRSNRIQSIVSLGMGEELARLL